LHSQCETTQFREQGTGAALFGYSKLYGEVPGGQAEYLRVPFGNTLPIKVPEGPPDDRFVYLSDVLPTAWQAVEYAGVREGTSLAVLGLGPVGDMSCRIAKHRGASTVIGVDLVPKRLARARARGVEALDLRQHGSRLVETIRDLTEGRGPDAVIDAVGMEAHGAPVAKVVQQFTTLLPDAAAAKPWPISDHARLILPKERPHPSAQLRITDHEGHRITGFLTNTHNGQLADLELRHRRHARVEDRIRAGKDTGRDRLPAVPTDGVVTYNQASDLVDPALGHRGSLARTL
jgi:threonine dehydrogenase-like Zn-dependent dehydrogenase